MNVPFLAGFAGFALTHEWKSVVSNHSSTATLQNAEKPSFLSWWKKILFLVMVSFFLFWLSKCMKGHENVLLYLGPHYLHKGSSSALTASSSWVTVLSGKCWGIQTLCRALSMAVSPTSIETVSWATLVFTKWLTGVIMNTCSQSFPSQQLVSFLGWHHHVDVH